METNMNQNSALQNKNKENLTNTEFPILVAEDDLVFRTLLERKLGKAGYDVTCVENGRQALNLLRKKFFPIVLTDWTMPEMNGLELCKVIREKPTSGYIFIILLTGKDSKEDIITGLNAGADDYLTKPFDESELMARLSTGKRVLSLEKSLKKAYEDIKSLSITDPLTGLFNRHYLMENLPREIKRSFRYKHPLSIVLFDLDHFKRINDTYGHFIGDQVLVQFSNCIKNGIRVNLDWIVRYGGEEFIIVAPETTVENAIIMTQRLCTAASNYVIKVKDLEIKATASFGVSGILPTMNPQNITIDTLISQADRFLYQAKQQGRNCVLGGLFNADQIQKSVIDNGK